MNNLFSLVTVECNIPGFMIEASKWLTTEGYSEMGARVLGSFIRDYPKLYQEFNASQDLFDVGYAFGKGFALTTGFYI